MLFDPSKATFPKDSARESSEPTPWAVWCNCSGRREIVFLTREFYEWQMNDPDSTWRCPRCLQAGAEWDDDNYESFMDEGDEEPDGEPG